VTGDITPLKTDATLPTNLPLGLLETASSPQPSPPEEEREKTRRAIVSQLMTGYDWVVS